MFAVVVFFNLVEFFISFHISFTFVYIRSSDQLQDKNNVHNKYYGLKLIQINYKSPKIKNAVLVSHVFFFQAHSFLFYLIYKNCMKFYFPLFGSFSLTIITLAIGSVTG